MWSFWLFLEGERTNYCTNLLYFLSVDPLCFCCNLVQVFVDVLVMFLRWYFFRYAYITLFQSMQSQSVSVPGNLDFTKVNTPKKRVSPRVFNKSQVHYSSRKMLAYLPYVRPFVLVVSDGMRPHTAPEGVRTKLRRQLTLTNSLPPGISNIRLDLPVPLHPHQGTEWAGCIKVVPKSPLLKSYPPGYFRNEQAGHLCDANFPFPCWLQPIWS